jgi:hypothetical protein
MPSVIIGWSECCGPFSGRPGFTRVRPSGGGCCWSPRANAVAKIRSLAAAAGPSGPDSIISLWISACTMSEVIQMGSVAGTADDRRRR